MFLSSIVALSANLSSVPPASVAPTRDADSAAYGVMRRYRLIDYAAVLDAPTDGQPPRNGCPIRASASSTNFHGCRGGGRRGHEVRRRAILSDGARVGVFPGGHQSLRPARRRARALRQLTAMVSPPPHRARRAAAGGVLPEALEDIDRAPASGGGDAVERRPTRAPMRVRVLREEARPSFDCRRHVLLHQSMGDPSEYQSTERSRSVHPSTAANLTPRGPVRHLRIVGVGLRVVADARPSVVRTPPPSR